MATREPSRALIAVHTDSRLWRDVERRSDDIFICTPPKSGTTWMQGIVASLLWPDGDIPGVPFELSPWVDFRRPPDSEVPQELDDQTHRRFIKTHSPADAIPIDDDCRYIAVHRDLRDVVVSWANHRTKMVPAVMEMLNGMAADDGVAPLEPVWSGDYDRLIDELEHDFLVGENLMSWWELRDRPNVLLVHFNDLLADLDGECRRIASFLDVPISEAQWPGVVERCTIDEMRQAGRSSERMGFAFDGGADSFFNRGTNGRWQGVLSDTQLDRLASLTASLPPDAAEWLEHGSLALDRRP